MNTRISTACLTLILGSLAYGQRPPGPGVTVDWNRVENRIAWFGTWKAGLAAARQTGRPILLVSAAPHCHDISGVW